MAVIRAVGIFMLSLLLLGASQAQALTLEKVGDFDQPTYVAGDPGNSGRLFVLERKGLIKALDNGNVTTFADFTVAPFISSVTAAAARGQSSASFCRTS